MKRSAYNPLVDRFSPAFSKMVKKSKIYLQGFWLSCPFITLKGQPPTPAIPNLTIPYTEETGGHLPKNLIKILLRSTLKSQDTSLVTKQVAIKVLN